MSCHRYRTWCLSRASAFLRQGPGPCDVPSSVCLPWERPVWKTVAQTLVARAMGALSTIKTPTLCPESAVEFPRSVWPVGFRSKLQDTPGGGCPRHSLAARNQLLAAASQSDC